MIPLTTPSEPKYVVKCQEFRVCPFVASQRTWGFLKHRGTPPRHLKNKRESLGELLISVGLSPFPLIVTTRIVTFLVYRVSLNTKPHYFPVKGDNPTYMGIFFVCPPPPNKKNRVFFHRELQRFKTVSRESSNHRQNVSRYARLLWEFWKRDSELFPPEAGGCFRCRWRCGDDGNVETTGLKTFFFGGGTVKKTVLSWQTCLVFFLLKFRLDFCRWFHSSIVLIFVGYIICSMHGMSITFN